jgi:hypothetical protein
MFMVEFKTRSTYGIQPFSLSDNGSIKWEHMSCHTCVCFYYNDMGLIYYTFAQCSRLLPWYSEARSSVKREESIWSILLGLLRKTDFQHRYVLLMFACYLTLLCLYIVFMLILIDIHCNVYTYLQAAAWLASFTNTGCTSLRRSCDRWWILQWCWMAPQRRVSIILSLYYSISIYSVC